MTIIFNIRGLKMPIDKTKLTKEMIEKALHCKTPEELIALAKTEGIEITKAEAEAYMDELQNVELDEKTLNAIAGGNDENGHCVPRDRY